MSKIFYFNRNSIRQRKLKRRFMSLDKPHNVTLPYMTENDIVYHKADVWAVLENDNQNIILYSEKTPRKHRKNILFYVADFLIFLRKRCKIEYCQCKGRKDRYDFFQKLYGADFLKVRELVDGESLYYIHISDAALRTSREIKKKCIRRMILCSHRKNG